MLKDIVILILYLPLGASVAYQQPGILFGCWFVRYPVVFVNNFPLLPVIHLKREVIYQEVFPFSPVFNAVYPPAPVFKTDLPVPFGANKRFHLAPLLNRNDNVLMKAQ
ncbi:MAG: hypothetical protein LBC53_10455 [Spirochaetaceae bacterium]|nr:hypothetical protein [Spirochaetaceae bacterium]